MGKDVGWMVTRTHNELVHKWILIHLAKQASLAKWLSVRLQTKWLGSSPVAVAKLFDFGMLFDLYISICYVKFLNIFPFKFETESIDFALVFTLSDILTKVYTYYPQTRHIY